MRIAETIYRPAAGEDETAKRIGELVDDWRERPGSIALPNLKTANVAGGGTTRDRLDVLTEPTTWRRLTDVAATNAPNGRLLYRAAVAVGASSAVEVGASLGIGSCWIASALARRSDPTMTLLDGAAQLLVLAAANVEQVAGFRPTQLPGLFEDTVPQLADELGTVDFVFVDGEHYYEPTMRDANLLIPHVRDGGAVVFDDVAWNAEMEEAWAEIGARADCALALEPRHRGSRRLGIFIKGAGGTGQPVVVVDDAPGPQLLWRALRSVNRRVRTGRQRPRDVARTG